MNIEVLIPVRNPTEVFHKTADSLVSQTERNFSVIISDNFSTTGHEHLDAVLAKFATARIKARKIRPPTELGRVEHWNWLHYQSSAEWMKPLFAGDWIEPDYVSSCCAALGRVPECAYMACEFIHHHGENRMHVSLPVTAGFYGPAESQDAVLRFGMQFGPPSAAIYRRDVFLKSGGYDPMLPICADSYLYCKLAARHGIYRLGKPLAHFLLHTARFSHSLPEKQRAAFREKMCFYAKLGVTAWHERWRFPLFGYARLFAREIRSRLRE
jgi:hypothetical protein